MYYSIKEAAALRPYSVFLKFEDGTEGVVDLDHVVGCGGVFDPLTDIDFFSRMRLDDELHTIAWPNGADLNPERLYETVKEAAGKVAVYRFLQQGED